MKNIKSCRRVTGKWEKGGVLIGLIITILAFAVLGTVLMQLFPTSISNQISSNQSLKAYYNAESGYRYAGGRYLHGGTGHDRDDTLKDLHSAANFDLAGSQGSFNLNIEGFFYEVPSSWSASPSATLAATAYGSIPTDLPTIGSGSRRLLFFNDPEYIPGTYDTVTRNDDTTVTFNINSSTSDLGGSSRVFVGAEAVSSGAVSGDTLTLLDDSGYELFPEKYGNFRFFNDSGDAMYDGDMFRYKERSGAVLSGIVNLTDPSNTLAGLSSVDGSALYLQRYIRLTSTGVYGSTSSLQATRTLTYNVPIEAVSGGIKLDTTDDIYTPDMQDLIDNNPFGDDVSLGRWGLEDVGGDALVPTATTGDTGDQKRTEAVIGFEADPNPFAEAWEDSGHFLNYDAQIKVAIGRWDDSSSTFVDKPPYYAAGLSLRVAGNEPGTLDAFGVSFMRLSEEKSSPSDGISDTLIPEDGSGNPLDYEPMIVLWDRDSRSNIGEHWLAYSVLADSSGNPSDAVFEDSGTTEDVHCDNKGENCVTKKIQHLKDWSTIYTRIVEAASIRLSGASTGINIGNTVVGTSSGARGDVVNKIHNSSGDEILLLNNVTGVFTTSDTLGTGQPTVLEWRAKDNYIWVFIGDTGDDGSDNTPLGTNRKANVRDTDGADGVELNWVPDELGNWATGDDYFTLVQWDSNTNSAVPSSDYEIAILGTAADKETNGIIRTNLWLTPDDVYDSDERPELGFHALGDAARTELTGVATYFDDFGFYIRGPSYSGSNQVGFLDSVVQE